MNVRAMFRLLFFAVLLCMGMRASYAQTDEHAVTDDGEAAVKYVEWIRQSITEGRADEAVAAIRRALSFSDVNSDISYLAALIGDTPAGALSRYDIIAHLDKAIEINRWVFYSENEALVLKAENLISMRKYSSALAALDLIREGDVGRDPAAGLLPLSGDAAMLRLKAIRGIAYNSNLSATETAAFRTLALSAMNRFSRDARPVKIFLEYLYYLKKQNTRVRFDIDISDQQVLDIIIRRLPVLVELDSDLAWMAAPFMQNEADAKRYVAAYRAGGFLENAAAFIPNPKSISLALNYGLINDIQAIEELFFYTSDFHYVSIDLNVLNDTYNMLRSEEGREMFTLSLLNFTGLIVQDNDCDGIIECYTFYGNGNIISIEYNKYQDNSPDIRFNFDPYGVPVSARVNVYGFTGQADVYWERYPFVKSVIMAEEHFYFRPADFSFAPVEFITLGGSVSRPGIIYPVLQDQIDLTRRTLVTFCEIIERNSIEFENAKERITLENRIPVQAVEILDGKIIAIAEFEGGIPVIQYADLDFDGRMETIRRFRRPGHDLVWPDSDEMFDYRRLISSSESDWRGDGKYKTGELYLPDGSVVYQWDMDGTGTMNYFETKR